MVSRLLEEWNFAMYPAIAVGAAEEEPQASRIGINDKFRLINVIFSEELHRTAMTSEEGPSRAELDAGLVGHNSSFWQLVHVRFHEGFPPDSTDGPSFLDEIQHMHPLFHSGDAVINPKQHGTFTAEKLKKVWKEILAEYDMVMVNFTKSGNHESSFTKVAMRVLLNGEDKSSNDGDSISGDIDEASGEEADEFGVDQGGFCCFTNSLPIVYLRMWLNEKPHMTSFISRRIPDECQLDTMDDKNKKRKASTAMVAEPRSNKKQKSPSETIADAFTSFVQSRHQDTEKQYELTKTLGDDMQIYMSSQSKKERIDLLEKQIEVLQRRLQSSSQKNSVSIIA